MADKLFDIETPEGPDLALIRFIPVRMDSFIAESLKQQLKIAFSLRIELGSLQHLILSFKQVRFIDSSILGILLGLWKYVGIHSSARISLVVENPQLEHLLKMCSLDHIFAIHSEEKAALPTH